MQTDYVEDAPKLKDDEYEKIIDAGQRGAGSCMEICDDEDWEQQYEDIVWPSEDVIMVPAIDSKVDSRGPSANLSSIWKQLQHKLT